MKKSGKISIILARLPKYSLSITIAKYFFPLVLICYITLKYQSCSYFVVQLLELMIIFSLTNCISNGIFSYIFNSVLMFLFNGQLMILIHSTSYLTYMMLSSLHSIGALGGKAVIYITSFITVIMFSALPVRKFKKDKTQKLLFFSLLMELCVTMKAGNIYSPLYDIYEVVETHRNTVQSRKQISSMSVELSELYKPEVENFRERPENLSENPNIILIFTEGISKNIIDDPRKIMPNVSYYHEQGLSFENYYNHTFATYRGLVGQLYSGFTFNDFDTNSLVSLQSILKDQGYQTVFINTEPNNFEFMRYLESFDFDELISEPKETYRGIMESLSDKEAYEKLWETVEKKIREKGNPFFVSIYTFGTHATFDSQDEKFGNGTSPMLNKFYNADYWFGEFMEKLKDSSISEDTIVVFTGDHCTYKESEYSDTFPDYDRENWEVDKIPFFIWYSGINSESIDVNGRNSIALAPTICDFIDISGENYFLGNSLFSDMWTKSDFDTIFCAGANMYNTQGCEIKELSEGEEKMIVDRINKYYNAAMSKGE